MISYSVEARIPGKLGRAGVTKTPHGDIPTPAFIPVGTKATVKALTPEQVRDEVGADAILANTYHLFLQPGTEILTKAGGLGSFMGWKGPTFTDSGGFQAFSLGAAYEKTASKIGDRGGRDIHTDEDVSMHQKFAKVTEDGVEFKSVLDGSTHFFTPERSIEIQHAIGADMIFAFDECTSPHAPYEYQKTALDRTHRWAKRCIEKHNELKVESEKCKVSSPHTSYLISHSSAPHTPALFGIVQGGRHEDLRKEGARIIGSMDFEGFGIGGSFDKEDIGTAVGWATSILPEGKPRHLLGIGEPEDLILGIENGIDTFDCVAPTRIARNGAAYVYGDGVDTAMCQPSRINLTNAQFADDMRPVDSSCRCYTCTHYSRAYLAHLFRAKEMLAATLTSIHNLHFLVQLVKDARQAIIDGRWEEFNDRRS